MKERSGHWFSIRRKGGLVAVATAMLLGGAAMACIRVVRHDQREAARTALRFATAAILQGNLDEAYALFDARARSSVSRSSFEAAVKSIPAQYKPHSLRAIAYEPEFGQAATTIFLDGKGSEVGMDFHCRVYLLGSQAEGYRVGGFAWSPTAFTESPARQLLERSPV